MLLASTSALPASSAARAAVRMPVDGIARQVPRDPARMGLEFPAAAVAMEAAGASPTHRPSHLTSGPLLTRSDAWYALGSVAVVAASATADKRVWEQVQTHLSAGALDAASGVEELGSPVVVGSALAVAWAASRITGHRPLEAPSMRIGASVSTAVAADMVLKLAFGRLRPGASPGDPGEFEPFHWGDPSFPSGHTTVAFATAAALDGETDAAWVPWVAYPLAAAVGCSRVIGNHHWTSDVVAGAALGLWTGGKMDAALRARSTAGARVGVRLEGSPGAVRLALAARY